MEGKFNLGHKQLRESQADPSTKPDYAGTFCYNLHVIMISLLFNFVQKLDLHKATLMKVSMAQDQKEIAREVLIKEFMSSEYSDVEEMEDGTECSVISVKPLPWRGAKASRFLKRLDSKAKTKMSKQSIHQTLPRVIGPNSTRMKPDICLRIFGDIQQ